MSTHKVILVNYSLGVSTGSVNVCGHSRVSYGFSQWNDKYRGHVCELPLEKYEKAIQDISRNWHKPRCKWVPYFVEAEEKVITAETNPALREIALGHARNLSFDDLMALMREKNNEFPSEKFEDEMVRGICDDTPTRKITSNLPTANPVDADGLPTKFFSLAKLARDEGVDLSSLNSKGAKAVRDAILSNRATKAA